MLAIFLWAFIAWAITSMLAGQREPFDYAIHNFSLGELRIVLWAGATVTTIGASLLFVLATCRYMRDF